MIHATGAHFNRISDDFARDQRIAHAAMAHENAISGGGNAEALRHRVGSTNALGGFVRQDIEVHIARRHFTPQRRDAHHRLGEIVVSKTDGA